MKTRMRYRRGWLSQQRPRRRLYEPRRKIRFRFQGIKYQRKISPAPNVGITVRLKTDQQIRRGAWVEITHSADGTEFHGKIMEVKE